MVGDVVVQLTVLWIGLALVDDPLIWALWGLRWVMLASGLVALRMLDRPVGDHSGVVWALRVISVAHAIVGIGSTVILPEYAPLVMLVVFGNLLMVVLLPQQTRRPQIAITLAACAATALVGVTVEPSLGESVPEWLLITVFLTHLLVTSGWVATFTRGTYDELVRQRAQARLVADRLAAVTADERRRIETALSDGVMVDLSRLDELLAEVDRRLAAGDAAEAAALAEQGADLAQSALVDLRRVAHGIFPDALRRYGLPTALSSLCSTATGAWRIESTLGSADRFPNDVEAAAYAWIRDLVVPSSGGTIELEGTHGLLRVTVRGGSGVPTPATADRVEAVGGWWSRDPDGAAVLVADVVTAGDLLEPKSNEAVDISGPVADTRVMERFLAWGQFLCIVGLTTVAVTALVTRSTVVALVGVALVGTAAMLEAARLALRRARFIAALVLVCVETCLSALVITALVPPIATVTALITMLPLLLALPFLGRRALRVVFIVQTAVLAVVALIGMTGRGVFEQAISSWVLASVVPFAAAGVAALVAATSVATTDEAQAEVDRTRAALRTLVRRSDDERQRIERDLHDGAQQYVVAASMQCRALARVAASRPDDAAAIVSQVRTQLRDARSDVVALVAGAFPEVLADERLTRAVRRSAAVCGLPTTVEAPADADVPTEVAVAVFYCIREGLQNAAKHAGAGASVTVRLDVRSDVVHFEVVDDGQGFDAAVSAPMGHGLWSLQARMESVGGEIRLGSDGPGLGARLVGHAPVDAGHATSVQHPGIEARVP
jgi:signal transduction histidine kinase